MTEQPTNDIKIECKSDDRNYLVFTRKIRKRHRKRHAAIMAASMLDPEAKGELSEQPEQQTQTDVYFDALLASFQGLEKRDAAYNELLQDVLIDAQLVVDDEIVSGVDAFLAADLDGVTVDVEQFIGSAFDNAVRQINSLGNAKRPK